VVHVHVGEDASDSKRMAYIGIATVSLLPIMRLLGKKVGAIYVVGLLGVEVTTEGDIGFACCWLETRIRDARGA
jgi:hypothetical protein